MISISRLASMLNVEAGVGVGGIDPAAIADRFWRTRRILVTPIGHAEFSSVRIVRLAGALPRAPIPSLTEMERVAQRAEAMSRRVTAGMAGRTHTA
jgi:hypothetical protein